MPTTKLSFLRRRETFAQKAAARDAEILARFRAEGADIPAIAKELKISDRHVDLITFLLADTGKKNYTEYSRESGFSLGIIREWARRLGLETGEQRRARLAEALSVESPHFTRIAKEVGLNVTRVRAHAAKKGIHGKGRQLNLGKKKLAVENELLRNGNQTDHEIAEKVGTRQVYVRMLRTRKNNEGLTKVHREICDIVDMAENQLARGQIECIGRLFFQIPNLTSTTSNGFCLEVLYKLSFLLNFSETAVIGDKIIPAFAALIKRSLETETPYDDRRWKKFVGLVEKVADGRGSGLGEPATGIAAAKLLSEISELSPQSSAKIRRNETPNTRP